jgi:hypothetical protein
MNGCRITPKHASEQKETKLKRKKKKKKKKVENKHFCKLR